MYSAQNLYLDVRKLLRSPSFETAIVDSRAPLLEQIEKLAQDAFQEGDEQSLLAAHRILYVIGLAQIDTPWADALNIGHPFFFQIKYTLEEQWLQAERRKHAAILADLPPVSQFNAWVSNYVQSHSSNVTHPLFTFLRDTATFEQMREFILQETPLEVLFGDIIAMMMPGVYGQIKMELASNFWDEVGHGQDARVHRNLRFRLMEFLQIPPDVYTKNIELLVREELALINMYLTLATNRSTFSQLVGALLATEHMIPGRFEYQIEGWRKRFGLSNETIVYLTEHTTVDVEHAKHWMDNVVIPLLERNSALMPDIVLGVLRRLDAAGAVCDRMLPHLKARSVAAVGAYRGEIPCATSVR